VRAKGRGPGSRRRRRRPGWCARRPRRSPRAARPSPTSAPARRSRTRRSRSPRAPSARRCARAQATPCCACSRRRRPTRPSSRARRARSRPSCATRSARSCSGPTSSRPASDTRSPATPPRTVAHRRAGRGIDRRRRAMHVEVRQIQDVVILDLKGRLTAGSRPDPARRDRRAARREPPQDPAQPLRGRVRRQRGDRRARGRAQDRPPVRGGPQAAQRGRARLQHARHGAPAADVRDLPRRGGRRSARSAPEAAGGPYPSSSPSARTTAIGSRFVTAARPSTPGS